MKNEFEKGGKRVCKRGGEEKAEKKVLGKTEREKQVEQVGKGVEKVWKKWKRGGNGWGG